jgi:hypothetical protein
VEGREVEGRMKEFAQQSKKSFAQIFDEIITAVSHTDGETTSIPYIGSERIGFIEEQLEKRYSLAEEKEGFIFAHSENKDDSAVPKIPRALHMEGSDMDEPINILRELQQVLHLRDLQKV